MIKKVLTAIVWFILFMAGLTFSASLISMANTLLNILGIVILGLIVAVSIKTKCLTEINFRKHEE